MRTTPEGISVFVKCPRAYRLYQKTPKVQHLCKSVLVATKILQKAYVKVVCDGYTAEWRQIVKWANRFWFKDEDIDDEYVFKKNRVGLERSLLFLRNWYNTTYQATPGYTDIQVNRDFMDYTIECSIPLMIIDPYPTVINVMEGNARLIKEIKRDYIVRTTLWSLLNNIDTDKVTWRDVYIGPAGGLDSNQYTLGRNRLVNIESSLRQILPQMANRIEYPSTGEQCNSCGYKDSCIL